MIRRALVVGLGVTGEAVARQLLKRSVDVVVVDDHPPGDFASRVSDLGAEGIGKPDRETLAKLVSSVDVVLPSPGVRFGHDAIGFALADGVPVWSEFELAALWDDRPIVAITGTNGKSTVTTLVADMLAAGACVVAAGNNDLPLVDAIERPDVETFVVEASSFRLQFTESFSPRVGTWLNLSPDHLDWHPSVEHYVAAKARIWLAQRPDDVAVVNADDPTVVSAARSAPSEIVTFGSDPSGWHVADGSLVGPDGADLMAVSALQRRLPHDIANALAATATAVSAGATVDACRKVLTEFAGLPHTMQLVGDSGGVRWYDDSKATTPASVVAAVSGFESVVLIAGGRNKGLDLSPLRSLAPRLRAVIAIGEAAPDVAQLFFGTVEVDTAESMAEAVSSAARRARPGDAVLLSPACASFDWYRSYAHRGTDFTNHVRDLIGSTE